MAANPKSKKAYASAGVDVDLGNRVKSGIQALVKGTHGPEVLGKIPELQSPKKTSLHPLEILRCLRLKVWDVDAQRMVGVSHMAPATPAASSS